MYDKYGFIVNQEKISGVPLDAGDSCAFMSWQAILYGYYHDQALSRNDEITAAIYKNRAIDLYLKCYEIDFNRHPTVPNTSYDMMVGWDYFSARWKWTPPPTFKERESAYWSGRHRGEWMFDPLVVMAGLAAGIIRPYSGERYYMNHLLALTAATTAERTGDLTLLRLFRAWVSRVEKFTGRRNPFFRRLALMGIIKEDLMPWGAGIVEWEYQRDSRLIEKYRARYANTNFHRETLPRHTVPLLMVEQFTEVACG